MDTAWKSAFAIAYHGLCSQVTYTSGLVSMQHVVSEFVVELKSLADTRRLGKILAELLAPPVTLALHGTLGSGKTELARAIACALGVPSDEVTSPTYVLVHRYNGRVPIYHIDLYRVKSLAEAWDLGLDEIFESESLTIIEWADKFENFLPDKLFRCNIELLDDGSRRATLEARGSAASEWINLFARSW